MLLTIGTLLGCSNGQEVSKTPKKSNSQEAKQAVAITYHPQEYQEKLEDTLLSQLGRIRVTIRKYPSMNKGKEQIYEYKGGTKERVHFRDMYADITVSRGDSSIFKETIGLQSFSQIRDEEFLQKAVLTAVWVDSLDSITQQVIINCNLCVPDTDWCYFFKIRIDPDGNKTVQLEETT